MMELKKEWFEPGLDGGSSLDERTGLTDRRTGWSPLYVRQFSRCGLPDRRRTTGTIADRGKASWSITATSATIHNADPNCPVHGQGAKA